MKFAELPGTIKQASNPPSFEQKYLCTGVHDSAAVKFIASSLVPFSVAVEEGILNRQNLIVEEQGHQLYHVTATYGQSQQQTGSYRFSGSTTGGTFHITHSKETVGRFPSSAVNHNQAIGVTKRGQDLEIDGADIVIPVLKLSYSIRNPTGYVNESFARNVARITSTVNDDYWHGFEPGELLFLGADFSDGTDAEAEVTYHFAAEENLQDLIIGEISGIQKQGHDLLWVSFQEANDGNKPGVKPLAVYVERVYRRIPFSFAFLF